MPAWVFLSVGVMMKLAGAKLTSALWVMPLVSRPAIGWLAINSAPSGKAACTGSTTPRFTPETSVTIVPGWIRCPYCLTHSSKTVGYKPKMMQSAPVTSASKFSVAPSAIYSCCKA